MNSQIVWLLSFENVKVLSVDIVTSDWIYLLPVATGMEFYLLFLWKWVFSWLLRVFQYLLDTKLLLWSSTSFFLVLAIEVPFLFVCLFAYNGHLSLAPMISLFLYFPVFVVQLCLEGYDYYLQLPLSGCLNSLSMKTFLAHQSRGQRA